MPKFNVLLKDDKTYPYIKINIKADYPDLYITRRVINDGAKYFGPYANAGSAKEMIEFIKSRYKIRQCRSFKYKDRPCLNYHIKKCMAPCMGYVTKEEYRKQINEIISILEGKTEEIKKDFYIHRENYINKVCRINAMETTKDFKFRHAKFLEFRDDITIEDCTFDKIFKED